MRLLLLHSLYTSAYSYYLDWRDAFREAPGRVTELDLALPGAAWAARAAAREHDLIVVLHSLTADSLEPLEALAPWLRDRGPARLCVFVGNEYNAPRSHTGMRDRIDLLQRLGPDLIASQLLPESARWLYAEVGGAQIESIPHALNPRRFWARTADADREFDIGCRSASYSPLLGDDDRRRVLERFARGDLPLRVDLRAGRLSGEEWAAYLDRCRGTVATEAGALRVERDDRGVNRAADWIARRHPTLALFGLERRLERGWLRSRTATVSRWLTSRLVAWGHPGPDPFYAGIELAQARRLLETNAGSSCLGKAISSRHFDAIGTRTCQILLEGRYNDLLEPGQHYLELAADFSNLSDVIEQFRDPGVRARIGESALEHALSAHTHAHRVRRVLELAGVA